MKNFFDKILGKILGLFARAWWVEISTDLPQCVYYFGPFKKKDDATKAETGYVEDLTQEGATVLQMSVVKRLTPAQLTVEYSHQA